uniref:protein-L-isoaspartate(D-aspartate) O-methyltransferase n=1 Tax=Myxobolus squamalis TaxID=59785 RepID=A0A6B2G5R5_MYXSQ
MLYQSHASNDALIQHLINMGIIKTDIVAKVMKTVDRKFFSKSRFYDDSPQTIGYGATLSAPHIHAHALEFLRPQLTLPSCRVLDVGCGSGYLSLCMSLMNDSKGKVVGVDHISELVDFSIKNVIQTGNKHLLENNSIKFVASDGRQGYPPDQPYDVIYVGAAAPSVPTQLVDQLAIGGTMLIPVGSIVFGQKLKAFRKQSNGNLEITDELDVCFVPLTDLNEQINR